MDKNMKEKITTLPNLDNALIKQITFVYNEYISTVSLKGHAASLELGLMYYKLCSALKPKSIVDLGSGFTSYVGRLYAQRNPDVLVYSVDDNNDWLIKTQRFLSKHNVSTDNIISWDVFQNTELKFDIVLYDLGRIPTRIANIDKPFGLVSSNGLVILDDAHFNEQFTKNLRMPAPYLSDIMADALQRLQFESHSLQQETIDCFGRYALAAWRNQ
jgi:hypothetical protein